MAKRLVKIAKEFNLATSTIVDFLTKNGFEIDNSPMAKVSSEMETALNSEFKASKEAKAKADSLNTRMFSTPKEKEKKKLSFDFPKSTPPPPPSSGTPPAPKTTPTPPPPVVKKEEPVVKEEPKVEEPVAETKEESPKLSGLKVKGKINLKEVGKKPAPKKEEKPPVEKKEEPVVEVEKKEEPKVEAPKKEEPKKEEPKEEKVTPPVAKKEEKKPLVKKEEKPESKKDEEVPPKSTGPEEIRAKTPQLAGLKVKGKVNLDKFKKPAKKKEETSKTGDKKQQGQGGDNEQKKRRKRKKVVKRTVTGDRRSEAPVRRRRGGNSKDQKEEKKEISQKEIEERIKQTQARLQGGGKNRRQKVRRESRAKKREQTELMEMQNRDERIQVTEFITVSELASLMDVPPTQVIMACMSLGHMVSLNQRLDAGIIEIIAAEFEHEVVFIDAEEALAEEEEIVDDPADLEPRAPIVTVMGHVDHGKTSLLDYVRSANVADGEAGGITQHIGAYEVFVGEGDERKKVTFLDTPGHEAFTAMRARGAKVTDVAIIIISADDKIMPQTKEAISHAQAAEVPIVFAINKIDKPGADPERIKGELAGMNFLVDSWGGQYQSADISAKHGTNIEDLLEKVLLEAEVLELKANPKRVASGVILEASLDKGRGYVSKVLVQTGTLNVGDPIVAGEHSGKVKAMFNERGKRVKSAGPSTPVLVLGLSGAPTAGEKFKETESEPEARNIAQKRAVLAREQANRANKRVSLVDIQRRLALGSFKELNLIVKGDVDGSVEALADSLLKQSQETVQINVIYKAVGQIIESDVMLASASDAIIVGFQVRPSGGARKLAEREGVEIKTYSVIYEAIDEIRSAIEGLLEPTKEEKIICEVKVKEVYKINRVGTIAGCLVTDGKISRNTKIRLIRDGIVVYPTKEGQVAELASLKRFKDDVREVKTNMECGLTIKNFNDIKAGDVVEGYEIVEIKQTLDD